MTRTWYLSKDEQTHGPYSEADMEKYIGEGLISAADQVWSQGMEQWLPAGQVFPAHYASTPVYSNKSKANSHRGSGSSCLKVVGLILVFILFCLNGWLYQAGMGVERTIFNANYYHHLFQEAGLTSVLHQGIIDEMSPGTAPGMPPEVEAEIELMWSEALSEAWLEAQILAVIEDLLAVLDGEQDTLTVSIDFSEPKGRLLQEAGVEEQVFADEMPDEIPLSDIMGADPQTWQEFLDIASRVQQVRSTLMIIAYVGMVILLLLFILLAGLSGGLKWVGVATLFSGISFLGGLQLFSFLIRNIMPPEELPELQMVLRDLFNSVTIVSLVYAGVGLFLLVSGLVLRVILTSKTST